VAFAYEVLEWMEALMRNLALAILTIGIVSPAAAQMYDPAYPVCLRPGRPDHLLRMQLHVAASVQRVGIGPRGTSASPIHISRARSSQRVIGGIAGSTKVNRIGRRTAYAMVASLLFAIVWQVLRWL
jgi:hypothetical protein